VQSIAAVASAAPEDRVDSLLSKAAAEAGRDTDPYRRWAVVAWIIEAAVARERFPFARQLLADALEACAQITPVKSRATALEILLQRAVSVGDRESRLYAEALLDAAAILEKNQFKKWQKWGASYVNRTAQRLSDAKKSNLAMSILEARLGTERAARVLSRHGQRRSA
jgi:hypothetical protein